MRDMVSKKYPIRALEHQQLGTSAPLEPIRSNQWKIYIESKRVAAAPRCIKFEATDSLPIYRPLLLVIRLRAHNRNGGQSRRRGRVMMFLLRMAFWLGLVLVLLPREKTPESEKMPQIGAADAVSAASAAVSDMSQFCKRQPAACDVGGQAASMIGQRATDGARKLYQIITDKRPNDHTSSIGDAESEPSEPRLAPHDTLQAHDLEVEWRLSAATTQAPQITAPESTPAN